MIGYTEGVDEIRAKVFNAWKANSAAIVGYVPEMRFADVQKETTPDKSKYWARVSVIATADKQATLSTCVDRAYARRYRENGTVVVQVFAPVNATRGDYLLGKLCELVQNALRGTKTPGGIWFRNAGIRPLPQEDLFLRRNVICNYERDEIV